MTEQEIYAKAMALWGNNSQLDMLMEEMAELTQAILKNRRRNPPDAFSENLHEEFVDVKIVMAQIELCLSKIKLESWKDTKLKRLEQRIKNHNI